MKCQVTEKIFKRFEKCGEPATHTCKALGLLCKDHVILALIGGLEPIDHPDHIDTRWNFSREGASAWCKLCERWRVTLDTGYKEAVAKGYA